MAEHLLQNKNQKANRGGETIDHCKFDRKNGRNKSVVKLVSPPAYRSVNNKHQTRHAPQIEATADSPPAVSLSLISCLSNGSRCKSSSSFLSSNQLSIGMPLSIYHAVTDENKAIIMHASDGSDQAHRRCAEQGVLDARQPGSSISHFHLTTMCLLGHKKHSLVLGHEIRQRLRVLAFFPRSPMRSQNFAAAPWRALKDHV